MRKIGDEIFKSHIFYKIVSIIFNYNYLFILLTFRFLTLSYNSQSRKYNFNVLSLKNYPISRDYYLILAGGRNVRYYTYYTSQPHHYMNFNSMSNLLYSSAIDPGIVIISLVTSIILTAITHNEFKKRSEKTHTKEQT
jgi:hypothetical protein